MSQPEDQNPARAEIMKAINRCAEAWHLVRAELPKGAGYHADQDNQYKASLAFLAQLPILYDLPSFQLYIACIAQGAAIGAVDPVDIGRFCHLAQTAMSAWKLANLVAPAAQKKEKDADPLPTKGNQPAAAGNPIQDDEARQAALALPDRETQKQLYKALRQRGIPVPSEIDLRHNPIVALYFCDLAQNHLDKLPPPDDASVPQPGPQPGPKPDQAPLQQSHQAA